MLNEIKNIISNAENETVEFKQFFSKAVIETLVAFSNSKGGQVLIGIDNSGLIRHFRKFYNHLINSA